MVAGQRRWSGLLVLVVLASTVSACGDDGGSEGTADASAAITAPEAPSFGGKLVYGLIGETNNWDPTAGNWGPWSLIVANAMFDTLARYNADGAVEPYLAEGFYPAQDYSQWRIKLREGVRFHNGETLDADALAANLQFHRDSPLTGSVFQHVTELDVVDDRNLRIVLDQPIVQFPGIFATQVGVVMAPEMIANPDRGREPIGTGPFRLDEWVPDARMVLVRNDAYWQTDADGNRLPYLDEVEFRPLPDDEARVSALLAGEVDAIQSSVPQDLASLAEEEDLQVLADPTSEADESFVMLNTAAPPFDELVARQALAYGTDREEYNEVLNDGLAQVAESPFRPESRWYHDVDYPAYDPVRARELVEQYEAEHGPLRFSILTTPSVRLVEGAQALQQQWERIGIDVEIESSEVATQITNTVVGDYQATLWAQFSSPHPFLEEAWWACDYVEPIPTIGLNFARHCNEELDAEMLAARQDDSGVRLDDDGAAIVASDDLKPYYDRVQELLAADLPYIWLYHVEGGVVVRDNVRDALAFTLPSGTPGLASTNGAHPLHQVWLDDA